MFGETLITSRLEYFMLTYRLRSYSAAASSIPMSYQGLKKAIASLETDLDVALFTQGINGSITPTPFATALFEMVKKWSADTRSLSDEFARLRKSNRRTVRLGVATGVLGCLGYDIIETFHKRYPELFLVVEELPDLVIDSALQEGEFNIAIVTAPYKEDFVVHELAAFESYLWVNKNHRLASRTSARLSDLEGETVVMTGYNFHGDVYYHQEIERQHIQCKTILLSAEMIWSVLYPLENKAVGLGIAHINDILKEVDNIVGIPLEDGYTWRFGSAYRKRYTPDEDEFLVMGFLDSVARSVRPK